MAGSFVSAVSADKPLSKGRRSIAHGFSLGRSSLGGTPTDAFLQKSKYHFHLLRLMQYFQLCYELPDQRDNYIAPQLLTEHSPAYDWDADDNLQMHYYYPVFMPRGVFSRLVVKLHHRIEEQRLAWRFGVILADVYARAEVLELRGERQIRIRVSGVNKRELLMEIVRALDELHRGFPRLRFERQIPCNCKNYAAAKTPHFYDLGDLHERLANRKTTVECARAPYDDVSIHGLLDEVGYREEQRRDGRDYVIYGNYYEGSRHRGDVIQAKITGSTAVAVGKEIQSTVGNVDQSTVQQSAAQDSPAPLSEEERAELQRLAAEKAEIERPLRRWAQAAKVIYVLLYLVLIVALWYVLSGLVARLGWNRLEPLAWIVGILLVVAGPLLAWLKPQRFSPRALEGWVFKHLCRSSYRKSGFDLERYEALLERSQTIR